MAARKHRQRTRPRRTKTNERRPNVRDVGQGGAEPAWEREFFAAGETLAAELPAAPEPEIDLAPGRLLTPDQLAKRNGYRRRVARLVLALGVFAVWAVSTRLSEVLS